MQLFLVNITYDEYDEKQPRFYQLINQGGFAMFTRDEFIIYVDCLIVQYFQRRFPNPLRHAGFAPALSDEEALTIELVGDFLGMTTDTQIETFVMD
jgi:hypothetical protein